MKFLIYERDLDDNLLVLGIVNLNDPQEIESLGAYGDYKYIKLEGFEFDSIEEIIDNYETIIGPLIT